MARFIQVKFFDILDFSYKLSSQDKMEVEDNQD